MSRTSNFTVQSARKKVPNEKTFPHSGAHTAAFDWQRISCLSQGRQQLGRGRQGCLRRRLPRQFLGVGIVYEVLVYLLLGDEEQFVVIVLLGIEAVVNDIFVGDIL